MRKTEVEKKLVKLARKMKKIYLEYLDSLEEEGNEIGKKEGYLTVAIFRDSISVGSTHDNAELKEENRIDWYKIDR